MAGSDSQTRTSLKSAPPQRVGPTAARRPRTGDHLAEILHLPFKLLGRPGLRWVGHIEATQVIEQRRPLLSNMRLLERRFDSLGLASNTAAFFDCAGVLALRKGQLVSKIRSRCCRGERERPT